MNLTELIEALESHLNDHPDDSDKDVLIVHQPNYPIQESLAGLYDPKTSDAEFCRLPGNETCARCGEDLNPGDVKYVDGWVVQDEDGDPMYLHPKCKEESDAEDDENNGGSVLYLVAGGQVYNRSPYGPRAAFGGAM